MPAYVIITREGPLQKPAEYDEYLRLAQESPPPSTLKPLVAYGAAHALKGPPPDGTVVLEFPTVEDAKSWYNGPYQKALPHRLASGDWRDFIVEGV